MPDEHFTELLADRIALRRFTPEDLTTFVKYRSDPDVARYQSWDAPYPLADGERMISSLRETHPDTAGEWFQYAMALRSTNELIGDCASCTDEQDPRMAEIGFTVRPECQGRGYATEGTRTLLGYLFRARGKHRVTARCDPRNTASARVLERIGMRREGCLREALWAKGEWADELCYAILDREWAELAERAGPGHR
jgi:RimJ/RimL family protein N-acetyltransferase